MHAKTLGFIHPKTDKEMVFSSILPQELNNLLKTLRNIDIGLENLISKLNRQFLHAKTLGFIHPKTNEEMIFSSILPQELNNILKRLRNTKE